MKLEELAGKLTEIKIEIEDLLYGLEDGITGEIKLNSPPPPPTKIKRKRRTKKEIEAGKMEGKSYRFERPEAPLNPPLNNLPNADTGNTFYGKPKKERKKRERKEPVES